MPELPFWQDPKWIATTILAVWGAGLATYQQISRLRERRPHVTVSLNFGSGMSGHYFTVGIRNIGLVDVFLRANCCMFEVKGAGFGFGTASAASFTPIILKPGDATQIEASFDEVIAGANGHRHFDKFEVRATVTDAIGRRSSSEWVEMTDHSAVFSGTVVRWSTPSHPLTDEEGKPIVMSAVNRKANWSWGKK